MPLFASCERCEDKTPVAVCLMCNRCSTHCHYNEPPPRTLTTRGFFEYLSRDGGWGDSFRVVDDDGMSFVLTDFQRAFDGRAVRITVELDEESEQKVAADTSREPYVYQQIGATRGDYARERQRRRDAAARVKE